MSLFFHISRIAFVGATLAGYGFLLATVVFGIWGLASRRGPPRTRRLRIALSSVLFLVASALTAIAGFYLVMLPSSMTVLRPEFAIPHEWCSRTLSTAVPVCLFAAAGLLVRVIYQSPAARKRLVLASLGCLVLALGASAASYGLIYDIQVPAYDRYTMIESRDWKTQVGDTAPEASVVSLDGSLVSLSDYRGKVLLVNFFATWCGPCQNELPHLQKMWEDLRINDDFQMLVIGRNESHETAAAFRSEHGYTFPMAVDPDASAFQKFADEGIPRTYLISRDGTILFQTIGFADIEFYQREFGRLREMIDAELEEAL